MIILFKVVNVWHASRDDPMSVIRVRQKLDIRGDEEGDEEGDELKTSSLSTFCLGNQLEGIRFEQGYWHPPIRRLDPLTESEVDALCLSD